MTSPDRSAAPRREQPLSQVLKALTELASLVALGTALLYYFGWRRSEAQARAFGADTSVFGMTTQDFVLRSLDVVLIPLLLLLAALLGSWLHGRLLRSRHVGRAARVLRYSWLLALVVGVPLLVLLPSAGNLTLPFWVTGGFLGTWYAAFLRKVAAGDRSPTPMHLVVLWVTLLCVCMFWMTERMARVVGDARADEIKADVEQTLNPVAVYSAQRLQLHGPEVVETVLPDRSARYRYRYDHLYLLQRSGGKYFLVTGDWSEGRGRLVILPDDAIRLEFGPGR